MPFVGFTIQLLLEICVSIYLHTHTHYQYLMANPLILSVCPPLTTPFFPSPPIPACFYNYYYYYSFFLFINFLSLEFILLNFFNFPYDRGCQHSESWGLYQCGMGGITEWTIKCKNLTSALINRRPSQGLGAVLKRAQK